MKTFFRRTDLDFHSKNLQGRYLTDLQVFEQCLPTKTSKGRVIIIWTGLNIKIDIAQKVYEL